VNVRDWAVVRGLQKLEFVIDYSMLRYFQARPVQKGSIRRDEEIICL
jgi:hypothetical protein